MPASPLVFVQTLPAARSPANCVDAADCNLAAKLRSFVLHHSDWPELIPAEASTENLHWDWYSKRGHFTCTLSRGRPSEMMCGDPAGSSTLRNGCQPYLLASLTSIAARFRACASMRASPKDNNCSIATTRPAIETYDIVDCV